MSNATDTTPYTQPNPTGVLPPLGGGPVSPEQEEFSFAGDTQDGPKSKYDFAFDPKQAYNARTVNITAATSKKGEPQYVVEFLGLQGPIEGLKFKKWLPLSGKGLWITEKTLVNTYGATKDAATKQVKFKKADVVGKLVGLKFASEEFNGKTRINVAEITQPVTVETPNVGGPIPF